jgi:hypothetical protein
MANTVTILSYINTFGDLLAQQNKAAVEINNISANNYTKETGTLYLAGSGTGLSIANTTVMNVAIISGTTSALGDVTVLANTYLNGIGYALNVANNAIIAKTLITDNFTANTLTRTGTIIASGTAYVNGITANTIIRSQTLNSTGAAYSDSLTSNTVVSSPIINSTSFAYVNNLTANNTISTKDLVVTGNISSPTITSSSFSGQATLTGVSTSVTPTSNTSNTQIATTLFVKNVLNSGNTFNIIPQDGVITTGSYSDPSWITSLAGSKITGNISGSAALNPLINPASGQKDGDIFVSGSTIYIWAAGAYRQVFPAVYS